MVIGLHVAIREFGPCAWYYFYAIWYLTTICVHGLNLVQFGISILILLILISCYKCYDQRLNSRNLKDIKLCTKFFYFNYHFFITIHKNSLGILNLRSNMKRKNSSYLNFVNYSPWHVIVLLGYPDCDWSQMLNAQSQLNLRNKK
jgi:hypothetical protein